MRADPAPTVKDLVSLREQLLENAFLFEEPQAYSAGVEDALRAVERVFNGHDVHAGGRRIRAGPSNP